MTPDGVIRVPMYRFRPPPTVDAYALTPEGEEALDASLLWDGELTDVDPTVAIPRSVAARATGLARESRSRQITGDPPSLL